MKTILLLAGLGLAGLAAGGCSYEDYHHARYGNGWSRVSYDPHHPHTSRFYAERRYYRTDDARPAGGRVEPGHRSY